MFFFSGVQLGLEARHGCDGHHQRTCAPSATGLDQAPVSASYVILVATNLFTWAMNVPENVEEGCVCGCGRLCGFTKNKVCRTRRRKTIVITTRKSEIDSNHTNMAEHQSHILLYYNSVSCTRKKPRMHSDESKQLVFVKSQACCECF